MNNIQTGPSANTLVRFSRACASTGGATQHLQLGTFKLLLAAIAFLGASTGVTLAQSDADPGESESVESQPEEAVKDIDDLQLLTMELPTIVTASRHEQPINTVPYAVSVITAEEIRRAGSKSVTDALRLAPGVDVASLTYGASAVSVRGFHGLFANYTLVLVDGRPIYDPIMSGTFWAYWPFQLEDIARIEVVRGPGVTWGANAVNGVINIITKSPEDQLGLTLTGKGASRGTTKEYVGYAFKDDALTMRLSSEFEHSDGYKGGGRLNAQRPLDLAAAGSRLLTGQAGIAEVRNEAVFQKLDEDYHAIRNSIHAIYEPNEDDTWTFSLGSGVTEGGWNLPFGLRELQPNGQANYLLINYNHEMKPGETIELTGYINDFYLSSGPRWAEYRYEQLGLNLSHQFEPAENHQFTWGMDFRWDYTRTRWADPFMLTQDSVRSGNVGFYAQDAWRFAPKWTLTMGGRLDYDFHGGFEPSGRASLAYDLDDRSLIYAAVSRAFQMPPAARRKLNLPMGGNFIHLTADGEIQPVTLLAYELGYRSTLLKKIDLGASVYWHQYDDVLTSRRMPGWDSILQMRMDNGPSFGVYGLELDLKYRVTDQLTLLGYYNFQESDSDVGAFGPDLLSPPKNKAMVGARFSPTDDLHLSSHLYYVDTTRGADSSLFIGQTRIASYMRLDLRAEHEFWDDRASVAVGVRNLTDSSHREGLSSAMGNAEVPRMIYGEVRISIP